MLKIYVNADEVWNYFQKHKARLGNALDVIAESVDNGVETGLQIFVTEENGYPQLSVEIGNEVLEKEFAISESDCALVARKFFKMVENFVPMTDEAAAISESNETDETDIEIIAEREFELCEAFLSFLMFAMGYDEAEAADFPVDEEFLIPLLDEIEVICADVGLPFYRPQVITDDDGQMKIIGL